VAKHKVSVVIDLLHEKYDTDEAASFPNVERQYRKLLRLTIGVPKTDQMQSTYWFTDESLAKLLKHRPSIKEMKLILEPIRYLSKTKAETLDLGNSIERYRYRSTLQRRLIEYFLVKYSLKNCMYVNNKGTT
jgi:hypothetical protein